MPRRNRMTMRRCPVKSRGHTKHAKTWLSKRAILWLERNEEYLRRRYCDHSRRH